MFASNRDRADAPDASAIAATSQDDENRRRARVLERKLSTPTTFADRRAEAAPTPGLELVSLGTTELIVNIGIHGGRSEVREGELLFDRAHPNRRYIRLSGDTIAQPLFDQSERVEERPVPLPPLRAGRFRRPTTSAYTPSQPDPPPRPA